MQTWKTAPHCLRRSVTGRYFRVAPRLETDKDGRAANVSEDQHGSRTEVSYAIWRNGMNCPSTEAAAIMQAAQRRRKRWVHILGVDLGKNICSLAGLDAAGAVIFRKHPATSFSRSSFRTARMCSGYGSLWWSPSRRPILPGDRPRAKIDVVLVCTPLREGSQNRRQRRGRNR
jgi:hypothetical protein